MLVECASPPGTVIVSLPVGPRKRRPRQGGKGRGRGKYKGRDVGAPAWLERYANRERGHRAERVPLSLHTSTAPIHRVTTLARPFAQRRGTSGADLWLTERAVVRRNRDVHAIHFVQDGFGLRFEVEHMGSAVACHPVCVLLVLPLSTAPPMHAQGRAAELRRLATRIPTARMCLQLSPRFRKSGQSQASTR
jgi:hypothetical protein